MLHYPAYVQNYLFATATEATLWEAATASMGDPVGNAQLGPWLRDQLIRPVSLEQSFQAQLTTISGHEDSTLALAKYLKRTPE